MLQHGKFCDMFTVKEHKQAINQGPFQTHWLHIGQVAYSRV